VTGLNILEGIDWVVDDVASRLYYSTVTSVSAEPTPLSLTGRFMSNTID